MMAIYKFATLVYSFLHSYRCVYITVNLTLLFVCLRGISIIMCLKLISFFPQPFPQRSHMDIPQNKYVLSTPHIFLISIKVTTIRLVHEKLDDIFGHLLRISKILAGTISFTSKMHSKSIHSTQFNPNPSIPHCKSILSGVFISSPYISTSTRSISYMEIILNF